MYVLCMKMKFSKQWFWQNCTLAFEKFQVLSDHEWRVLSRTGLFVLHLISCKNVLWFWFSNIFYIALVYSPTWVLWIRFDKSHKMFLHGKQAKWQKSLMINLFLRTIDLFMSLLVMNLVLLWIGSKNSSIWAKKKWKTSLFRWNLSYLLSNLSK